MRSSQARARNQFNTLVAAEQSADYSTCIETAPSISPTSSIYPQAQTILGNCYLARARQLAQTGQFKAAIASAHQVPRSVPAYEPAQTEIPRWSERILELATQQFQTGELEAAIAMAEAIPNYSPTHSSAQLAIRTWQQQWQADEANARTARQAFERGDWADAIAAAEQVSTPHWQAQVANLTQQSNAQLDAIRRANRAAVAPRSPVPATPPPPTRVANPATLQSPVGREPSENPPVADNGEQARQEEDLRQQRQRQRQQERELARQRRDWEQVMRGEGGRRRGQGGQQQRERSPSTIERQIAREIESEIIRRVEDIWD